MQQHSSRRDQRVVCFVSWAVGRLVCLATTPVHFANRALVTSLHGAGPQERLASVCDSAAGVALRLRFAKRSSAPSAPLSPLADRRPKPQLDFPCSVWRSSACRSNNSRVRATSVASLDSLGSAARYSRTSNLLPKSRPLHSEPAHRQLLRNRGTQNHVAQTPQSSRPRVRARPLRKGLSENRSSAAGARRKYFVLV